MKDEKRLPNLDVRRMSDSLLGVLNQHAETHARDWVQRRQIHCNGQVDVDYFTNAKRSPARHHTLDP